MRCCPTSSSRRATTAASWACEAPPLPADDAGRAALRAPREWQPTRARVTHLLRVRYTRHVVSTRQSRVPLARLCTMAGSLGYAERLSWRDDVGGRLGDPELLDAGAPPAAQRSTAQRAATRTQLRRAHARRRRCVGPQDRSARAALPRGQGAAHEPRDASAHADTDTRRRRVCSAWLCTQAPASAPRRASLISEVQTVYGRCRKRGRSCRRRVAHANCAFWRCSAQRADAPPRRAQASCPLDRARPTFTHQALLALHRAGKARARHRPPRLHARLTRRHRR